MTDQAPEEDRAKAARWIRENAPQLCFDDGSIGEDDLDSLAAMLAAARAAGEVAGRESAEDEITSYWDNYCTNEARPEAFKAGAEAERRKVVEFLRHHPTGFLALAEAIEAGAHKGGEAMSNHLDNKPEDDRLNNVPERCWRWGQPDEPENERCVLPKDHLGPCVTKERDR